ncbi:helix-turn-helix transcriptional regulator [Nocardia sp. NRRL S-836]|uniref:helix-turn-helix domain-containing protein n=1 Tax=Nocardia sp. NRRL S-836 TaxID=1519492 RepID=UPI0006ADE2A4|nr:helix-turn-helix transcriptional regulator [Nocardia sp. NRRL S-836]KOV84663.1 hypothetical protein ADL03_15360 [Nocardia sp. NRRL S-836]
MTTPEQSRLARDRLSHELRRLRTEAKMTGTAAARATGMSQSKLSKIEHGMLLPSVTDVERLVSALGATKLTQTELVGLARQLHAEAETRRVVLHRGLHRHQNTVSRIEAKASTIRTLQITRVPTLVQTDDYLRAALGDAPAHDYDSAATTLKARRDRMNDPTKQFIFLLTENALRWRMGPTELMCEQLDHLRLLGRRRNVRLGVVPWTAEANLVVPHGFEVYDERVVTVSVLTGNATITDPPDVREYLELFSRLDRLAVHGQELEDLLTRISVEHRQLSSTRCG